MFTISKTKMKQMKQMKENQQAVIND